jgi:hypothetical protein
MAERKIRAEPRISTNKLAEYMVSQRLVPDGDAVKL